MRVYHSAIKNTASSTLKELAVMLRLGKIFCIRTEEKRGNQARRQVARLNSTRTGKISSRPKSMSNVNTSFAKLE